MSVLNNRITYLLTYIYMRDTTLLLIYYGPVLNAPAIFELVVVRWCYGYHKIDSRISTCTFDKDRSAAHVADRLIRKSTIYCVFVRLTHRDYPVLSGGVTKSWSGRSGCSGPNLKISRRNPCSPFFSVSYSINRHKIL